MNTRRIPFQFSTADPLARQRELEKRFGLQPTCPKMYVDVNNPLSMSTTPKEISSPRLQHRVPIFIEGYDQPIHSSSVDSMASVPESKKPNVRVIPIEVEGADSRSPRHRTYSGPAGIAKDRCASLSSERNDVPPFKKFNFENMSKPKLNTEPKVFNIPIQVEGANNISRSSKSSVNKIDVAQIPKSPVSSSDGFSQSKSSTKVKSPNQSEVQSEPNENQVDQPKNNVEILLKKIDDVLNEFKTYESGVVEFTGTSKDKEYRFLDEMLTRCMLRLDDIDTMGNEEIRLARKSAVKKIQASIDLLESKANAESATSTEVTEKQLVPDEMDDNNEVGMQDNKVDDCVVSVENTSSVMNQTVSNEGKIFDSNLNDNEAESKIESIETEERSNIVTDIEMSEMPQNKTSTVNGSLCETTNVESSFESKALNLSEVANKIEDMMQEGSSVSSLKQQNNIPEIEMSEEILNKNHSVRDVQLSELLGFANKCAEQNEVSNETSINDVEMLDEKDPISNLDEIKESLSLNEIAGNDSHSPKSDKIFDVEMGDISSKESGVEKENDPETIDRRSSSKDAEINDVIHETVNECLADLSKQDTKSQNSQSEKKITL